MSPNALIAGLAVGFGAAGVFSYLTTLRLRRTPRVAGAARGPVLLTLATQIGRRYADSKPGERVEARLLAAGQPYGFGIGEVVASKFGGALVIGLLALPFCPLLPGKLPLVFALGMPLLGFYLPDLHLRDLAARRRKQISRELADVLDLMRVTVSAGFGLERAFAEVGRRHVGVLAKEMALFAKQLSLGVSATQALTKFERRCPVVGVESLIAALQRTVKQGTPLSEVLSAQSREARSLRTAAIREHSAKASPKIQMLVALILTPSVMLSVAAMLANSFT